LVEDQLMGGAGHSSAGLGCGVRRCISCSTDGDGAVSFYENEPVDDPFTRRLGAWQTDTHARPKTEANQTPKF
jgi:hypothetical protein